MRSVVQASAVGLAVVASVAVVSVVGIEPTAAGAMSVLAGADILPLQVLEKLTELLDRVADFLTQLNRVLSEFAQLFGEGGGGGD